MPVRPLVKDNEGDFSGDAAGFLSLSPDVFRESHENGLLKPFGMDGRGEGRSAGTGGGDIAADGDTDRVVEDAREVSSGGLSGTDVRVESRECAITVVCEPKSYQYKLPAGFCASRMLRLA